MPFLEGCRDVPSVVPDTNVAPAGMKTPCFLAYPAISGVNGLTLFGEYIESRSFETLVNKGGTRIKRI